MCSWTSKLTGQLIYAVSADDEVAPAKVLDEFAKTHPTLELVVGFSGEGLTLAQADVKALARLPSKHQLIAEVVEGLKRNGDAGDGQVEERVRAEVEALTQRFPVYPQA